MKAHDVGIIWDGTNEGWYLRYSTDEQNALDSSMHMPDDAHLSDGELYAAALTEACYCGIELPTIEDISIER